MNNSLYDDRVDSDGFFASALERSWFYTFRDKYRWHPEYIGHQCDWADILIDGQHLEIKPDFPAYIEKAGERFITMAPRNIDSLIVVAGSPGFPGDWYWMFRSEAPGTASVEVIRAAWTRPRVVQHPMRVSGVYSQGGSKYEPMRQERETFRQALNRWFHLLRD